MVRTASIAADCPAVTAIHGAGLARWTDLGRTWLDRGMLLCLLGPAGSGKSTTAKFLEKHHPQLFARVPVDFFFLPRSADESVGDYLARPFEYDWQQVDNALSADGTGRSTPDCDFTTFDRKADHGGMPITNAPVYVLDGMRPHPRCGILVLLQLDATTQTRRLQDRDVRWGTTVATRTEHLRRTYDAGRAELPRKPDLTLPATDPIEHNAEQIRKLVVQSRGRDPLSSDVGS
jgi:thymidylate kinase